MREITLGKTGITTCQNAFGALPIQRISRNQAVNLLRHAYEGGMRFFDTARAYSDSEEKLGAAFEGMREKIFIASKTQSTTAEGFWKDLETTLSNLETNYLDLYQLHMATTCYGPGDEIYDCLVQAKNEGKIRHIGITAHRIEVAFDIVRSGYYETLQFPFSYLSGPRELELVKETEEAGMGFIAMKGLAGGLITNSRAAMAFMNEHPSVLPIWGIQSEEELEEWLSYMDDTPSMTPEISQFIEKERTELTGDFCRGCGYCAPCPVDIKIDQCARMSLMLRRAPAASWLSEKWQKEMDRIDNCIECRQCETRCPYSLHIPELLKKNKADYDEVLAGKTQV